MTTQEITAMIHSRVTMPQAVLAFTQYTPRRDRIPCPIHGGKNPNLGFTDKLYHCFVCNDGGDVIRFVQHIRGCSFRDACAIIGDEFGLDLHFDRPETYAEREAIRKETNRLFTMALMREEQKKYLDEQYATAESNMAFWDRVSVFGCRFADQRADYYHDKLYEALAEMTEVRQ